MESRSDTKLDIFACMNDQAMPILFPYDPTKFWEQLREVVREEITSSTTVKNIYETPGLTHKPIYTLDEITNIFQISKPTVYDWTRHGKLKPVKIRGRVYFLSHDIQQLLKPDEQH